MNMNQLPCDREKLKLALSQSLDEQAADEVEQHVSKCESCQQEIQQIAGDEGFWRKASAALLDARGFSLDPLMTPSSSVFVKIDPSLEDDELAAAQRHEAKSLLDPPLHPEMLGRIDGFSVEQMIGRGGMGVVYKGFDAELNRPVAIKFLAPHLAANGVARKRFAREARAAAAVVHSNVVPIYSVNSSPVRPYLVMSLVSGRSLQKHVEDHGPLPVKDIVRIAQQVAAGLSAAHEQGLVHRDIKPANILLEKDVSRVMITDFGLARAADDASLTQSGWLAGTPHYMSPEQAAGEEVDRRSDLFSLGSVMYFMATGREPFRAEKSIAVLQKIANTKPVSCRSINSEVPAMLDELIRKLLSKDPVKRFESAERTQEVMTQYLAHLQNPKAHRKPKLKLSESPRRSTVLLALALMLPLSIAVGYSLYLLTGDSSQPARISVHNAKAQPLAASKVEPDPAPWVVENPSSDLWQREINAVAQQMDELEWANTSLSNRSAQMDAYETEKTELLRQIISLEQQLGPSR